MGAAHGLAGTAPVIALVPATQLAEWPDALVYLSFFGVGTTLAMACFAAAAAAVVDRLVSSIRVVTAIARAVALAALLLGLLWMLRALGGRLQGSNDPAKRIQRPGGNQPCKCHYHSL